MRAWFLGFLFLMTPAFGGDREPLRLAERLTSTIGNLRRESIDQSSQAADPRERRKLLDLAEEADDVQSLVHREIVRELELGTPLDEIARRFYSVREKIAFLSRLAQALREIPRPIALLLSDIELTTRELQRCLVGGGGGGGSAPTAQCEAHTESNPLTGAKTHVTCRFFGKNLVKWEVLLNVGSTKLEGHLYPELADQHIETERVRAGWWPTYEVFVTDRYGRRTLVAKK